MKPKTATDHRAADNIQRAKPGTCQYLVRAETGERAECGLPPKWRGRKNGRLLYCEAHGQMVGRSLEVIALELDVAGRRQTMKPFRDYLR